MVFEQLYATKWLERRTFYAFLMGLAYSVIGITSAIAIFPEDPGLAAVAFTSLILLPSMIRLLSAEEKQAALRKRFNLLILYKDHKNIFKIYFFMFLGILLTFSFFSLALPFLAASHLFEKQVSILTLSGKAVWNPPLFWDILINNFAVLSFCLIFSLVYGAGAVFLITWNASVWGVVFGVIARDAAAVTGQNPFVYFILTITAVSLHMILEASSYFLGAISGGIVSEATVRENPSSKRFKQTLCDGLVMFFIAVLILIIAAFIEVFVTGKIVNLFGL